MTKDQLAKILDSLNGIHPFEWERLKISVDREFKSQLNASKFQKTDSAEKNIGFDVITQ
ncbi:MAG: hypothetical protein ABF969_04010 [Sporolactobacillus sp.]